MAGASAHCQKNRRRNPWTPPFRNGLRGDVIAGSRHCAAGSRRGLSSPLPRLPRRPVTGLEFAFPDTRSVRPAVARPMPPIGRAFMRQASPCVLGYAPIENRRSTGAALRARRLFSNGSYTTSDNGRRPIFSACCACGSAPDRDATRTIFKRGLRREPRSSIISRDAVLRHP